MPTQTPNVSSRYGSDVTSLSHSMLGLSGLVKELQNDGVTVKQLLENTGITAAALDDADARMTHQQKLQLFRNALRLAKTPGTGLRAGQQQRLSDFGVYGYAVSASGTFGEAVSFGIRHIKLAGPVLEKSFRLEGDLAIFEGHEIIALGELMPLVSEFWFSSINTLIEKVMERRFPAIRLLLPYAAPAYAAQYEAVFGCPVEFGTGIMQWHFDPSFLDVPCPNANRITADMCMQFCDRMLKSLSHDEPDLVRTIRGICLNASGGLPGVEQMAATLCISPRTLHRRLSDVHCSYQDIVDDVRRRLSEEFLRNTDMSIDEVSARVGFSDASNFRKAFKKWTGRLPTDYRA